MLELEMLELSHLADIVCCSYHVILIFGLGQDNFITSRLSLSFARLAGEQCKFGYIVIYRGLVLVHVGVNLYSVWSLK